MNKILLSILLCFFTATYTFAQNPCECTFKKKAPKGTPFHLYNTVTEIVVLSYKEAYGTYLIVIQNMIY